MIIKDSLTPEKIIKQPVFTLIIALPYTFTFPTELITVYAGSTTTKIAPSMSASFILPIEASMKRC